MLSSTGIGKVSCASYVQIFSVSRSGYYGFLKRMSRPEKMPLLPKRSGSNKTNAFIPTATDGCGNGWKEMRIHHNPKTILRVMKKIRLAG